MFFGFTFLLYFPNSILSSLTFSSLTVKLTSDIPKSFKCPKCLNNQIICNKSIIHFESVRQYQQANFVNYRGQVNLSLLLCNFLNVINLFLIYVFVHFVS